MKTSHSRFFLLLLFGLFLAPLIAALALHFGGWRPPAMRNHGYLYSPARDFQAVQALDSSGREIKWRNQERRWHLLLIAPETCDARCASMLDKVRRVWVGLGRHAADLDVHFVGVPDDATRAALAAQVRFDVITLRDSPLDKVEPETDGLPVYLVDPHGFLVMRFDSGFEPGGLRRDLQRLLR